VARPRVSCPMQEQVLHLFHKEGFKIRRIAKALKLSRNTVRGILREGVKPSDESEIPCWARPVDWEKVKRDYHCGVTLKVLHAEMAPTDVTYKVFWHYFRTLVPAPTESVTIRLEHKPGEKTFFEVSRPTSPSTTCGRPFARATCTIRTSTKPSSSLPTTGALRFCRRDPIGPRTRPRSRPELSQECRYRL